MLGIVQFKNNNIQNIFNKFYSLLLTITLSLLRLDF